MPAKSMLRRGVRTRQRARPRSSSPSAVDVEDAAAVRDERGPSCSAVPAWKTSAPRRLGVGDALDRRAASRRAPGSRAPASTTVTAARRRRRAARRRAGRRRAQPRAPRAGRPRAAAASDCVSGSPKRQLNSSTRGPSAGQHQPGVEHADERRAAPRELARATGAHGRARRGPSTSSSESRGTGEYEPMPPVFGPSSPSPIRL